MINQTLILAVLAGVGLSLATGPLGAFVVWRRMAYFGNAIAHAAILGVAIALAFSMSIFLGTLVVSLGIAIAAATLSVGARTMDATLGVLSYSALALGLVALSLVQDDGDEIDVTTFLFGDILTVTGFDVAVIWIGSGLILALLILRWAPLLTATISDEFAVSVGINPRREQLVLIVSLALVVALALKLVGALLIGALLIIPAAAARGFAKSPEAMAAIAALIGALSALGGIAAFAIAGTPAGPGVVVTASLLYAVSLFSRRSRD